MSKTNQIPVSSMAIDTTHTMGFGGFEGRCDTYANGYTHEHGTTFWRHFKPHPVHVYKDDKGKVISREEFDEVVG